MSPSSVLRWMLSFRDVRAGERETMLAFSNPQVDVAGSEDFCGPG